MLELWGTGASDTYYNLLVQGFQSGQLTVQREPPPELVRLADPYANSPYRMLDHSPVGDITFYHGKLYLYFGITPVLLLFWPYVALTGHFLLHKDAVVIFCSEGFLASVGLLYALWRRYFAQVNFGVMLAGTVALDPATGIPMIAARSDIHEVAISCGYALTMLALTALWGALHDPKHQGRWLTAASLAYGLAVRARSSLLFGAVILLVPIAPAWFAKENGYQRRPVFALLMAAIGPIAFIGLGLMLYNMLRFDNPFEFGWRYQLDTPRQDTAQGFSLSYLWFNFWVYFLEPARWSNRFPFVDDIILPPCRRATAGPNIPLVC
jgi:hypothetical protein